MSVTDTYRLVHSARGKLTREAQRNEHDLRLLVGHANLLDSLMIELEHAEDEQQSWYTSSSRQQPKSQPKSWATTTTIVEEHDLDMADGSDDEADSDSDSYDEMIPVRAHAKPEYVPQPAEDDSVSDDGSETDEEDDISDDDDAHNLGLALCRTRSHSETSPSHPPELVSDSDDSDDDSAPPSPPQPTLDYSSNPNFAIITTRAKPTPHQVAEDALLEDGFYIPNTQPSTAMVAAC